MAGPLRLPKPSDHGLGNLALGILQMGYDKEAQRQKDLKQLRDDQAVYGGSGNTSNKAQYYRDKRNQERKEWEHTNSTRQRALHEQDAKYVSKLGLAMRRDPENRELHELMIRFANSNPLMQEQIKAINPDRTGRVKLEYLDDGRTAPHVEMKDGTWKPWSENGGTDDRAVVGQPLSFMKRIGGYYAPYGNDNPFDAESKIAAAKQVAADEQFEREEKQYDHIHKRAKHMAPALVSQLSQGYSSDPDEAADLFTSDLMTTFANSKMWRTRVGIKDNPTNGQLGLFAQLVVSARKYDRGFKEGSWFSSDKQAINTKGTLDMSKLIEDMTQNGQDFQVNGHIITADAIDRVVKDSSNDANTRVDAIDLIIKELGTVK